MKNIENENYFIVYHWMVSELKLKGSELVVFALIYSYCMSSGSFTGSQNYISRRTGIANKTVTRALKELEKKQIIIRKKVSFIDSEDRQKVHYGTVILVPSKRQNDTNREVKMSHNNKEYNKEHTKDYIKDNTNTPKADVDFFNNYDWSRCC